MTPTPFPRPRAADRDYRKMVALLAVTIVLLASYDIWVVASGNLDLARYLPGGYEAVCLMWLYIIRRTLGPDGDPHLLGDPERR